MPKGRQLLDLAVRETELQANVLDLASRFRWLSYHTFDSRRSARGYPDLTLVRGDRIIFAELKSERGRVTTEQRQWLAALGEVTTVDAQLWRPSDWPDIEEALR